MWRRYSAATLASTTLVVLACGGTTTNGGGSGSGGGGPAASACDHYYDILYATNCSSTAPPQSELTRVRARFEKGCASLLALPGVGITASALDACASAVETSGCAGFVTDCNFVLGTMASGASCVQDAQCQSGRCTLGSGASDGGASACGSCTPGCGGVTCAAGTKCDYSTQMCLPVTRGGAGASCNGVAALCNPDLVCNLASHQCVAPGGVGTPCTTASDCSGSLACPPPKQSNVSTCQNPGPTGAPCYADGDCAAGLGCSGGGTNAAPPTCVALTWAGPGQPCGDSVRCLVGQCNWSSQAETAGTCPAVIADGQPCDSMDNTKTCDTIAVCAGGKCELIGTNTCP